MQRGWGKRRPHLIDTSLALAPRRQRTSIFDVRVTPPSSIPVPRTTRANRTLPPSPSTSAALLGTQLTSDASLHART